MLKIISTIVLSVFFSYLIGQDKDATLITLTYFHGLKLEKIQEPGSRFVFKQLCTTQIDSLVTSGDIKHQGSKIGKIKDCIYQWKIRNDTLVAVIIETNKRKNTQQAIEQATDQFGLPTKTQTDAIITYFWIVQQDDKKFYAKLTIDEITETGIMTITI